ncbi:MAG: hypothetical protein EAZ85_11020 [Bacteroidetes bacterium]|nr:MAG: hypothetical protein EAZ85_11020 [Bacteroidota bacterium]TAG85492.1 MAG: hypothetical protein EAZ20_14975 [Bacteroidota bacterium]
MNHNKAVFYFQNLYLVAIADKILASEEKEYLLEVAKKMGLSTNETTNIMLNSHNLELTMPETKEEQLTQLEDVITMMMMDKKIHDKEYDLCLRFGQRIGLNKKDLDLLILKVVSE